MFYWNNVGDTLALANGQQFSACERSGPGRFFIHFVSPGVRDSMWWPPSQHTNTNGDALWFVATRIDGNMLRIYGLQIIQESGHQQVNCHTQMTLIIIGQHYLHRRRAVAIIVFRLNCWQKKCSKNTMLVFSNKQSNWFAYISNWSNRWLMAYAVATVLHTFTDCPRAAIKFA